MKISGDANIGPLLWVTWFEKFCEGELKLFAQFVCLSFWPNLLLDLEVTSGCPDMPQHFDLRSALAEPFYLHLEFFVCSFVCY